MFADPPFYVLAIVFVAPWRMAPVVSAWLALAWQDPVAHRTRVGLETSSGSEQTDLGGGSSSGRVAGECLVF
jgi:hypothetical protein